MACLYLAGGLDVLRDRVGHPWLAVLPRVLAAWIFAVVLLMLALWVAPVADGGRG